MDPYIVLCVTTDASDADIKAAYRLWAQRTHPDRPGGDCDAFDRVQKAYDILSDPERRKRFDETGDIDEPTPLSSKAEQKLASVFNSLLEQDVEYGDLIAQCRSSIKDTQSKMTRQLEEFSTEYVKLASRLGRVEAKDFNLYESLIQQKIDTLQHQEKAVREEIDSLDAVLELLKDYTDTAPKEREPAYMTDNPLNGLGGINTFRTTRKIFW